MPPRGLIYGVGINDADYFTYSSYVNDVGKRIYVACPYYKCWTNMLSRCYNINIHKKKPTYSNCSVCSAWHLFSNFRSWMIQQDWQGKSLDKDILVIGNKIYSPDTCVFVENRVNNFINETPRRKGSTGLIGVSRQFNTFYAESSSVETGEKVRIGSFKTEEEAHLAWIEYKLKQARILAKQQNDPRVAKALLFRYENYSRFNILRADNKTFDELTEKLWKEHPEEMTEAKIWAQEFIEEIKK